MSGFWSLTGYEYKKILYKKSVWIMFLLLAVLTPVGVCGTLLGNYYVDGKVYESNYEAFLKDRAAARSLSGREINPGLLMEAAGAYAQIPEADRYSDTPEYQAYARKYSELYQIVRSILYTDSRPFGMPDFQILTEDQAKQLYTLRREKQEQEMAEARISDKAKENILALDARIKTPFTFSYAGGYTRLLAIMMSIGLNAAFAMAVCVSPLFAEEYSSGADQLILTAKHGKRKLIHAKLFTGYSLAAVISLVVILTSYAFSMLILGADGRNAPLQLFSPMSPYPLTMGQTLLLLSVCTIFACLLTASLTMLLSAKFKSPFGVIIIIGVLLVVPMLFNPPDANPLLGRLFHLLPTSMMDFGTFLYGAQYELFGLVLTPYQFLPMFAALVCVLVTPFAFRAFKNHQIN